MISMVKEQMIKSEEAALGIHFMERTGVESDFKGMRGRQIAEIRHLISKFCFKMCVGSTVISLEDDQIRVKAQGDVSKCTGECAGK